MWKFLNSEKPIKFRLILRRLRIRHEQIDIIGVFIEVLRNKFKKFVIVDLQGKHPTPNAVEALNHAQQKTVAQAGV